jgi:hypothetical protein
MKRIATLIVALVILSIPVVAQGATPGQTNAARSAKQYLQFSAFSRTGLIKS